MVILLTIITSLLGERSSHGVDTDNGAARCSSRTDPATRSRGPAVRWSLGGETRSGRGSRHLDRGAVVDGSAHGWSARVKVPSCGTRGVSMPNADMANTFRGLPGLALPLRLCEQTHDGHCGRTAPFVLFNTDAEVAGGFRKPPRKQHSRWRASRRRRLSCCHKTRLGACGRQPPFRHRAGARPRSPGAPLVANLGSRPKNAEMPALLRSR